MSRDMRIFFNYPFLLCLFVIFLVCLILFLITRRRDSLRASNILSYYPERLQKGCVLLPNNLTPDLIDALQKIVTYPIHFFTNARTESVEAMVHLIETGETVCFFPEAKTARSGTLWKSQATWRTVLNRTGLRLVPVWLEQTEKIRIVFGASIASESTTLANIQQTLLELGEFCYSQYPALKRHLARACVRGLHRNQWQTGVTDGMDDSSLKNGMLLAAGIVLSRYIKRNITERRVAIVLPPSKGGIIANLAVLLAGKVPVNLNFTAGEMAITIAMKRAETQQILTAQRVQEKLKGFPWTNHLHYLEKILPSLKLQILIWRVWIAILPAGLLIKLLRLPSVGGHEEAVLLFTSGSSGEPKGVVLSHRNILGNISQFAGVLNLEKKDALLATLPFFHSFGCTVTLWYPMIEGIRTITFPNPLDAPANAELIEKYKIAMLLATPTFLRSYLRRIEPKKLRSLKLIITGAEKLPIKLAESFEARFGIPVMEGYGLTETTPVVSVNLPTPNACENLPVQESHRLGSVGRMIPGVAAQIRNAETGVLCDWNETGMLWLRGANIFEGYLEQPEETAKMIQDGWLRTGDLARFDEDGFLFIEGRLSRFSKIGGEMVPHETIESKIAELLGVASDDERKIAVVGVADPAKGEVLVLLTTLDLDPAQVRNQLQGVGFNNLFIPKTIKKIEKIPVLGSGKLDLNACKKIAES